MNVKYKVGFCVFITLLLAMFVYAIDFNPNGDIELRNIWKIKNATSITTQNLTVTGIVTGLNSKITIAGENITSGTINFARLPTLTNMLTLAWANITDIPSNPVNIAGENITSGTIAFARLPTLTNMLTLTCSNITGSSGALCRNQTADAIASLQTIYYNATTNTTVTGTPVGTLSDLQVYDGITYNVTEASADLDFRINFSGVTAPNQLIVRMKSSTAGTHLINIALWDYLTGAWESYTDVSESTNFIVTNIGIFDPSDHVSGGVAQMRISSTNLGADHTHYFDWATLTKGVATPSGAETDPYSIHKDGTIPLTADWNAGAFNITASYFLGDGSKLTGVGGSVSTLPLANITNSDFACPASTYMTQFNGSKESITCAAVPASVGSSITQNITADTDNSWSIANATDRLANIFSRIVTANFLYGDGSNVTGVSAASLGGKIVGTGANNIVALDGSSKLPAVDGSQLTGVSGSGLPDKYIALSVNANLQTIEVQAKASGIVTPIYSDNPLCDTVINSSNGLLNTVNIATTSSRFNSNKYERTSAGVYTNMTTGRSLSANLGSNANLFLDHTILAKRSFYLTNITVGNTALVNDVRIKNASKDIIVTSSGSFVGNDWVFTTPFFMEKGVNYVIGIGHTGTVVPICTASIGTHGTVVVLDAFDLCNVTPIDYGCNYDVLSDFTSIGIREISTGYSNISVNLSTSGTLTGTSLFTISSNRQVGDNITYDLFYPTHTETNLSSSSFKSFFRNTNSNTSELPTRMSINLVGNASNITVGYPSLRSYCLALWNT